MQENDLVRQLKGKLEETEGDLESLQATLQHTRNEYKRKQEYIKKESESKIDLLVQQLKREEGSAISGNGADRRRASVDMTIRGTNNNAGTALYSIGSGNIQRPSTSAGHSMMPGKYTAVSDSPRRLSDANLSLLLRSSFCRSPLLPPPFPTTATQFEQTTGVPTGITSSSSANEAAVSNVEGGIAVETNGGEEVLRRWQAEKDRREVLERRNGFVYALCIVYCTSISKKSCNMYVIRTVYCYRILTNLYIYIRIRKIFLYIYIYIFVASCSRSLGICDSRLQRTGPEPDRG